METTPQGFTSLCTLMFSVPRGIDLGFDACSSGNPHNVHGQQQQQQQQDPPCAWAIEQLDEAIKLIHIEGKKEYLEALRLSPDLVATESNPMSFLRVEDMNPWSAARRLTLYWKYRKETFKERWLRPFDLSGNGALNAIDVENIKKDVVVVQKWPGEAAVAYVDFERGDQSQHDFPCRVAFFMASMFTDVDVQQSLRFYLIKKITPNGPFGKRHNKPRGTPRGQVWEFMRKALPIRLHKVFHLIPQRMNTSDAWLRTVMSLIKMSAEFFLGEPLDFISDCDKVAAYAKLRSSGLADHCIPQFLGGSWDLQGIAPWRDATVTSIASPSIHPINQHCRRWKLHNLLLHLEHLTRKRDNHQGVQ